MMATLTTEVGKSLEKSGVLEDLKLSLRKEIFKALIEEIQAQDDQSLPPKLNALLAHPDGSFVLALVQDLLLAAGLTKTSDLLTLEVRERKRVWLCAVVPLEPATLEHLPKHTTPGPQTAAPGGGRKTCGADVQDEA